MGGARAKRLTVRPFALLLKPLVVYPRLRRAIAVVAVKSARRVARARVLVG